jgi:tetratricopeptide (TPR) repeat protein
MTSARKYVNEGNPEEALVKLEDAARRYPTEPVVQSLLAIVQQSVTQQRTEKRKVEVTELAQDAIRRNAFDEAVERLEAARAELSTPDFDDLIAFAHDQAEAHKRQERVTAIANQAQALLKKQELAQAIELLEKALQESPDEELRFLLEDAKVRLQEQQRIEQDIIDRADQLLEQDRAEDAVALLEEERGLFANSPLFTAALDRAHRKRQWLTEIAAQEQEVRLAFTSGNFDKAEIALQECRSRFGERPEFARLQQQLERVRRSVHCAAVEKAMSDAMLLAKIGSLEERLQTLQRVSESVRYLSPDETRKYDSCAEQLRAAIQVQHRKEGEKTQVEVDQQEKYAATEETKLQNLQQNAVREWEKPELGAEQASEQKGYLRAQFGRLKAVFNRGHLEPASRAKAEQHEIGVQQLTPPSGIVAPGLTGQNHMATESVSALTPRDLEEIRSTSNLLADVTATSNSPGLNQRPSRLPGVPPSQETETTDTLSGKHRWSDYTLGQIERQLAVYVGPVAKVIVRRAALRATDWDELFSLAAESLDTASERQTFLACKEHLHPSSSDPARSEGIGTRVVGAAQHHAFRGDLDPALTPHATRLLARYVGPISRVLVKKAMQRADSVQAFYLLLADELESKAERTEFLRAAGILDEK